ncbi:uncharacterized protein [Diadema antillarum]|uniref:uncharacterized protein n=1 Tax=Diadema antillarum TaxID=105358 RepID=UPI003A89CCB0
MLTDDSGVKMAVTGTSGENHFATGQELPADCAADSGCRVKSFVFLDLETSHLHSSDQPTIMEISLIAVHRLALVHPDVLTSVQHAWKDDGTLDISKIRMPRVADKLTLCLDPRKHTSPMSFALTKLDNLNLIESKKMPFDDGVISMLKLFLARQEAPVGLVAHNGNGFDFPLLKTELARLTLEQPLDDILCIDSLDAFRSDFVTNPVTLGLRDNACTSSSSLKRKAIFNEEMDYVIPDKREMLQTDTAGNCNLQKCNHDDSTAVSNVSRDDQDSMKHGVDDRTAHCEYNHSNTVQQKMDSDIEISSKLQMGESVVLHESNGRVAPSTTSKPIAAPHCCVSSLPTSSSSLLLPQPDVSTNPSSGPSTCAPAAASMTLPCSSFTPPSEGALLTGSIPQQNSMDGASHGLLSSTSASMPTDSSQCLVTSSTPDSESRRSPPPPPIKSKNMHPISHSHEGKAARVSFSLVNIFKRTFGMPPPNSHAAEDDIIALMQIILPRAEEFAAWADEKATEFKNVGLYYKPLNPRRKLEF